MEHVSGEVRTASGRYRLRASPYCRPDRSATPLVLVIVERLTMSTPSEADLCKTFSLTRTEVRVASLLAAGMTNAQVALISTSVPTQRAGTPSGCSSSWACARARRSLRGSSSEPHALHSQSATPRAMLRQVPGKDRSDCLLRELDYACSLENILRCYAPENQSERR